MLALLLCHRPQFSRPNVFNESFIAHESIESESLFAGEADLQLITIESKLTVAAGRCPLTGYQNLQLFVLPGRVVVSTRGNY